MLQSLPMVIKILVPYALHDALGIINQSEDPDLDFNGPKDQKRSESPNIPDQNSSSDLLNSSSDIKAAFSEASQSLNLFESYIKNPREEASRQLKQLYDRGKRAYQEFLAAGDICPRSLFNLFPSLKTKKSPQIDKSEYDKPGELDRDNYDSEKEDFQFFRQPNLEHELRELKIEILALEEQLESIKVKNQQYEETLSDLGRFTVEETAKRNEERKSQIFHQIYRSPLSGAKRSLVSTSNDTPMNVTLGYPKDYHSDQQESGPASGSASGNPSIRNAPSSAAFIEQPTEGDEVIVQCPVSSAFNGNNENHAMPGNLSIFTSTDAETNGAGGSNQSGDVDATSNLGTTSQQSYDNLSFPVQQHDSGMESITLANKPATSVATTLYNNYKLLLLTLAQRLLSSEVVLLQDWAAQSFSIVNPQNATDVFFQLDEKRVINASDLSRLCAFFESIIRFDLVYIVDAFLLGDYSLLRENPASKKQNTNDPRNSRLRPTSRIMNPGQFSIHAAASGISNSQASKYSSLVLKPGNRGGADSSVPQQSQQSIVLNHSNTESRGRQQNPRPVATSITFQRKADLGAAEGHFASETRTMTANSSPRANASTRDNAQISQSVGSNGSKLSKFQRPDTERTNVSNPQSRSGPRHKDLDLDDNWLCSHYKRHCYVRFECCENFWPCHRCHNNQSTCGRKKLKSRDTKMVKCAYCEKVQEFGEHCCNCGAKFANYYCGSCKHLTGNDDHPYHCDKCGICRIHGDRSFHCDVCGVCLDVQLRGNHKCRAGSAHDECCICLEDAFTGCQILPCSHKVHKECATQMIRSGITRCPICRESFAHKLERRPFPTSRKRAGK